MKITRLFPLFTLCMLLIISPTTAKEVLKVGVTANMPPLIYKEAGQYAGLESELAQKLAKKLGREIEFVEVDWIDQIPSLVEGRTDIIMSGMTITRRRNLQIAFSDPYFEIGQMGLIRTEDQHKYPTIYFVKSSKARIGVVKATTGELLVRQMMSDSKIKTYKDQSEAINALRKKHIDTFIHDSPVIWSALANDYITEFSICKGALNTEYLGWGIRKTDDQLLSKVNRILKQWQKSGEFNKVVKKWMPFLDAIQ